MAEVVAHLTIRGRPDRGALNATVPLLFDVALAVEREMPWPKVASRGDFVAEPDVYESSS